MIIDFHTHIFPADIGPAILKDLSTRTCIPHYNDGSLDSLLHSMNKNRINASVVSRITTSPKKVVQVNQWLLSCKQDRIIPLAAIHPEVPDLDDYVASLKASGFKGIKIHPDYQGFYVDDPKMYPVYDAARQVRLPILFHAGLDRGLPPPVHALPHNLLKIHQMFPDLVMVAAHMGGEDNYEETKQLLLGRDIYLDTAFVLRIMKTETLRHFFSAHPIERFLFGTDNPFTDQTAELKGLLDLPILSWKQKKKILGQNAARLLGIEPDV